MILNNPWWLLLFLSYVPLIWWYLRKKRSANPSLGFSTLVPFAKIGGSWKGVLEHVCFALQLVALGCIIVAIARPQSRNSKTTSSIEGTDIVIAIDVSTSMSANDLRPNRFEAAKKVASEFVQGRPDDNIAIVAFGGESLSLMPLTSDRQALLSVISNLRMGDLDNGTAIGDGLASAVNRLSAGQAKSKSIILLTDGTNNTGEVAPSTAADIARDKHMRVYTIGVGTDQTMQITDPYGFSTTTMETKIDEESLKEIAQTTNGKFFRAKDENALKQVFHEIDSLEKSRLDVNRYSRLDENFFPWALAALCAYGLMIILRYTILRRIP
ncbi:MAG: VWA domain-containing protein [Clostridium sp.]|nr:VWA domain-containing protein [Prevotella sp.]MCM1428186.1 VWA domain-containing protein [Clostridium sp.]MCM1475917.1 VWA domain-containing protein [Muribaculaceae bacterium]